MLAICIWVSSLKFQNMPRWLYCTLFDNTSGFKMSVLWSVLAGRTQSNLWTCRPNWCSLLDFSAWACGCMQNDIWAWNASNAVRWFIISRHRTFRSKACTSSGAWKSPVVQKLEPWCKVAEGNRKSTIIVFKHWMLWKQPNTSGVLCISGVMWKQHRQVSMLRADLKIWSRHTHIMRGGFVSRGWCWLTNLSSPQTLWLYD